MKFENTEVFNFKGALRGMRNPLESWNKSDSFMGMINTNYEYPELEIATNWTDNENKIRKQKDRKPYEKNSDNYEALVKAYESWLLSQGGLSTNNDGTIYDVALIGPNDLELAQRLVRAGNEHAKFMRQIFVCVDITAPIYWWKEADTYKIGTVVNSTSTMHKLASTPITIECFEIGDYNPDLQLIDPAHLNIRIDSFLDDLEQLRQIYFKTKDKRYWKELVRWLPESWLQTRTMTMDYANLRNIYFQRKNHKLTEWHQFCEWIKTLPYAQELIMLEDKNEIN